MKRFSFFAVAMAAMLVATPLMTSCGDDPVEEAGGDVNVAPVTPSTPDEKNAMTPLEQKEYLEKVAIEFMDQTPASDWDAISDLAMYVDDTYEDYDADAIEDWADDVFNGAREALGITQESEKEEWNGTTYYYNYVYTNYKSVVLASNIKGHFTAKNGKWEYEKANDLQFIFNDRKGNKCVAKIETSGNEKKVHMFNDDDWDDYTSDSSGNTITYTDYIDRTQYTLGIPEKIVATLTQGSQTLINATININLSNITNENFDLSKSSLDVKSTVEFHNGYKVEVSQAAYTANSKAAVTATFSKGGKDLIAVAASGSVSNLPSVNLDAFMSGDFDDDDFDKTEGKNAFAKIDILGKVQIQGKISDIRKFVEYMEDADDNNENEKTYKSYINQANSLLNLDIFYDGSSTRQASIKLEPFVDDYYYGETYWYAEPVICFYDGSSYSTFEAFFNDKDFKTTIDVFKRLADKYAALVDEKIDWD